MTILWIRKLVKMARRKCREAWRGGDSLLVRLNNLSTAPELASFARKIRG